MANYSAISKLAPHRASFTIYPNPVKDLMTITFNNPSNANYTINITSIDGKRVYKTEALPIAKSTGLNTSTLSSGVYLLTLTHPNGAKEVRKFVRE